jgi:hypothetical protein
MKVYLRQDNDTDHTTNFSAHLTPAMRQAMCQVEVSGLVNTICSSSGDVVLEVILHQQLCHSVCGLVEPYI